MINYTDNTDGRQRIRIKMYKEQLQTDKKNQVPQNRQNKQAE